MQKEARGHLQESSKLLKSFMVYDITLPESNLLSANRLIEEIVEASALGDIEQVDALEATFQTHVQYLDPDARQELTAKLDREKTNTVNFLRARRGVLIGRKGILNSVIDAIQESPVVTLLGTAGTGKSRLRSRGSPCRTRNFDQAFFCDLSTSMTELDVVLAVAHSMGIELRNTDPQTQMVSVFSDIDTILVLDNVEQVIEPLCECVEDLVCRFIQSSNHCHQSCSVENSL